jgi:hypothetical protein
LYAFDAWQGGGVLKVNHDRCSRTDEQITAINVRLIHNCHVTDDRAVGKNIRRQETNDYCQFGCQAF